MQEGKVAVGHGGGTAAPDEPPVLTVGFATKGDTKGTPRGPEHTQFQWKSSAGFPSVGQMERILVVFRMA